MEAIKTKGAVVLDYRIKTEIKFATEEGGYDRYLIHYEVYFNGEWKHIDLLVSLNQDMDQAANELKKQAIEKWNIQELATLNFNQNG